MASKIEWTGHTWNPIVGCRRVSPGCEHCYAERTVHRGMAPQHKGLTVLGKKGPRWNGEWNLATSRLDEPLRRKGPTTYFVNSLSDLFFEVLPFELVAAILGIMAATPQHTYQVLTKRPGRAVDFFRWYEGESGAGASSLAAVIQAKTMLHDHTTLDAINRLAKAVMDGDGVDYDTWPLPNVHIGVSIESDEYRAERLVHLRRVPNAVPWVSQEPQLGPVTYTDEELAWLRWVVIGGESGPGARPFELEWARRTIAQCDAAGVPVFMKQLGSNAKAGQAGRFPTSDTKGGDMTDWPAPLRRREMPNA